VSGIREIVRRPSTVAQAPVKSVALENVLDDRTRALLEKRRAGCRQWRW
jgi:hypothetical protein